jgi:hypothetical protein
LLCAAEIVQAKTHAGPPLSNHDHPDDLCVFFFFVFFREQKEVEACGQARFEWCRGGIKEVDE